MAETTNYNLFLTDNDIMYFNEWREKINGKDASNMVKIDAALGEKVDKIDGKNLSTNDYTMEEKEKLSSIAIGATNYVHPDNATTRHVSDGEKLAWNGKEDAFTKNDAFNKSYGTTAGTTAQGNDGRFTDDRPNPNALTFTGAVEGTYDGSTPVSITVPIGSPIGETTTGTSTAYALNQKDFILKDGAEIKFKLNVDSGTAPTINVNGTGAKSIMMGDSPLKSGTKSGTWLTAIYSNIFDSYLLQGACSQGEITGVTQANLPLVNLSDTPAELFDFVDVRGSSAYLRKEFTTLSNTVASFSGLLFETSRTKSSYIPGRDEAVSIFAEEVSSGLQYYTLQVLKSNEHTAEVLGTVVLDMNAYSTTVIKIIVLSAKLFVVFLYGKGGIPQFYVCSRSLDTNQIAVGDLKTFQALNGVFSPTLLEDGRLLITYYTNSTRKLDFFIATVDAGTLDISFGTAIPAPAPISSLTSSYSIKLEAFKGTNKAVLTYPVGSEWFSAVLQAIGNNITFHTAKNMGAGSVLSLAPWDSSHLVVSDDDGGQGSRAYYSKGYLKLLPNNTVEQTVWQSRKDDPWYFSEAFDSHVMIEQGYFGYFLWKLTEQGFETERYLQPKINSGSSFYSRVVFLGNKYTYVEQRVQNAASSIVYFQNQKSMGNDALITNIRNNHCDVIYDGTVNNELIQLGSSYKSKDTHVFAQAPTQGSLQVFGFSNSEKLVPYVDTILLLRVVDGKLQDVSKYNRDIENHECTLVQGKFSTGFQTSATDGWIDTKIIVKDLLARRFNYGGTYDMKIAFWEYVKGDMSPNSAVLSAQNTLIDNAVGSFLMLSEGSKLSASSNNTTWDIVDSEILREDIAYNEWHYWEFNLELVNDGGTSSVLQIFKDGKWIKNSSKILWNTLFSVSDSLHIGKSLLGIGTNSIYEDFRISVGADRYNLEDRLTMPVSTFRKSTR